MGVKGRPKIITINTVVSKSVELYWKKGIQNVTYNSAINYSGYSKGTVYNLFKSEDELQAKTLDYYSENDLLGFEKNILRNNDLFIFINFLFKSNLPACYFMISNINKRYLRNLSKASLIKIEKKFKKLLTDLIIKHINKHKLNSKNLDIPSLAIYLFHNFSLLNIMKLNKRNKRDFKMIKNSITEKILKSLHNN